MEEKSPIERRLPVCGFFRAPWQAARFREKRKLRVARSLPVHTPVCCAEPSLLAYTLGIARWIESSSSSSLTVDLDDGFGAAGRRAPLLLLLLPPSGVGARRLRLALLVQGAEPGERRREVLRRADDALVGLVAPDEVVDEVLARPAPREGALRSVGEGAAAVPNVEHQVLDGLAHLRRRRRRRRTEGRKEGRKEGRGRNARCGVVEA